MSKPRPKFCVGEEVRTVNSINPIYDSDRSEVRSVEWSKWPDGFIDWEYQTELTIGSNLRYREGQLRKLPPEDRTTWEDCAWMPKEAVK